MSGVARCFVKHRKTPNHLLVDLKSAEEIHPSKLDISYNGWLVSRKCRTHLHLNKVKMEYISVQSTLLYTFRIMPKMDEWASQKEWLCGFGYICVETLYYTIRAAIQFIIDFSSFHLDNVSWACVCVCACECVCVCVCRLSQSIEIKTSKLLQKVKPGYFSQCRLADWLPR